MTSLLRIFISFAVFCSLGQIAEAVQLDGYDYIVVGSGPGGAPLAARLGLAGYKVLVIEAGGDIAPTDWNISVPFFNSKASEDPLISWDFYVRPDDPFSIIHLTRTGEPLPNGRTECEGSQVSLPASERHLGHRTKPTCKLNTQRISVPSICCNRRVCQPQCIDHDVSVRR